MFVHKPAIGDIVEAAKAIEEDGYSIFLMLGEHCGVDVPDLIRVLNEEKIDFFGGVFPAVIYDEEQRDTGVVLKALPIKNGPYICKGLGREFPQIPQFPFMENQGEKKHTALVLVDGLAANIAGFLEQLFSRLARNVSYLGGGAGSLSLQQKPCLFTPEGFFQDGALIVFLDLQCKLGVRHGWERVAGPLVATKTDRNRVYELNWQNAFEVYRQVVEENSKKTFTEDNFFDLAKAYPFGLLKDYSECVVRDPLALGEEGELICVGEVPEHSVLDILKGVDSSLIASAGQAAADALPQGNKEVKDCLIADCISRVLFLEDQFPHELRAVKEKLKSIDADLTSSGILTLGEISSYGEGYLEFFNKTIVVGVLHE